MSPNDGIVPPNRSEAELVELIGAKTADLRRRRMMRARVAALALGSMVVVALAIVSLASLHQHGSTGLQTTDGTATTATTGTSPESSTSTSSVTTTEPASASTSTLTETSTTQIPTTSLPDATTTSLPPGCQSSQFAAETTADKSAYATGETIRITVTIRNTGADCFSMPDGLDHNPDVLSVISFCYEVTAANSAGDLVWDSLALAGNPTGPPGSAICSAPARAATIPAGWSNTTSFSWNQENCAGDGATCTKTQVPAGRYTIRGWADLPNTPAVVTIG